MLWVPAPESRVRPGPRGSYLNNTAAWGDKKGSELLKMEPRILESLPVLLKICLLKGFVDVLRLPEKDAL